MAQNATPRSKQNMKESSVHASPRTNLNMHTRPPGSKQGRGRGQVRGGHQGRGGGQGDKGGQGRSGDLDWVGNLGHGGGRGQNRGQWHGGSQGQGRDQGWEVHLSRFGDQGQHGGLMFHPPALLSQTFTLNQQNAFQKASQISHDRLGKSVGHGHSMARLPAPVRAPLPVPCATFAPQRATTKQQNLSRATHLGDTGCLMAPSGAGSSIQSPGHVNAHGVKELKQGNNSQTIRDEKYNAGNRVEEERHSGTARGGRGRGGRGGRGRGQNSGRAGKSKTGKSLVTDQMVGTNKPGQISAALGQPVTPLSQAVAGNNGGVRKEDERIIAKRRSRRRVGYRVRGRGRGRGSVPSTSFAEIASTIAHGLASPVMNKLQKIMNNLLLKEEQVGDSITADDRSRDSEGGVNVPVEISGGRCIRSRTNKEKEIDGRTFQRPLYNDQSGVWYETSGIDSESRPSSCVKEQEEEVEEEEEDEDELEEEGVFIKGEIVCGGVGLANVRQTHRAGHKRFRLHGALRGVRGGFRRKGVLQHSGHNWAAAPLRNEEVTIEDCDDSDARSQVSECSGSQVAASDIGSWTDVVEEMDEKFIEGTNAYQQARAMHSRGLRGGRSRGRGRSLGRGQAVHCHPVFAVQELNPGVETVDRAEAELRNCQKASEDVSWRNRTDQVGTVTEEMTVADEPKQRKDSNQSGGQCDGDKSTGNKKRWKKTNNKTDTDKKDLANSSSQSAFEVEQNLVIEYLVNHHKGSCSLFDVQNNSGIFPCILQPEAVLQSLGHCSFIRVLVDPSDLDNSTVKVYMKKLRLCVEYRPPKGCFRNNCQHVHLCRDFLTDCCFAQKCTLDHDVESEHNMKIMIDSGVEIFRADQKLSLIRCANLLVCFDHNSSEGCPLPRSCFKMHVCNSYILNRCLIPGDVCLQGHDLFSEQNMKILRLCGLDQLNVKFLLRMVVGFHPEPFDKDSSSVVRKQHKIFKGKAKPDEESTSYARREQTSEWMPTEQKVEGAAASSGQSAGICNSEKLGVRSSLQQNTNLRNFSGTLQEKSTAASFGCKEPQRKELSLERQQNDLCKSFEEHACDLKENCTELHGSQTPYLWRVQMHAEWFDLENNELIEEEFSNPAAEKFWGTKWDTTVHIDFLSMMSEVGPVQRLSTPSYAMCRDRADATRWLWYWLDSTGKWILYGQNNEPPYQDVLEAKFLNDPRHMYCFQINDCNYELDFAQMEQRNLKTNFCRPIRRRPFYRSLEGMEMPSIEYYYDQSKLPFGWAPMDTKSKHGTELVPLHPEDAEYGTVRSRFFATLKAANFKIQRIYRLQNLDLWQSFQMKKVTMENNTRSPVEEANVYHGTPEEETIRWICSLGFDQRMHGRHGAKYGTGVYFATTAKYSHCYTQLSERGLRYMFYARVLVGRAVEGKGEYRRPPPIDPLKLSEGLYDTCVDNVAKPSIYVVFDNSQSYPEYLIEYQDVPAASEAACHQLHSAYATTADPSYYARSPSFGAPPSAAYPPHSGATWSPAYTSDLSSSDDSALRSQFYGPPPSFTPHPLGNYPPYVHDASLSGSETWSSACTSQVSGQHPHFSAKPSTNNTLQYDTSALATASVPSNLSSAPTDPNQPYSFAFPSYDSPPPDPSYSHQQPKNCCIM